MRQQLIYREKVKAGKRGKAIGLPHVLRTKWRFPRHEMRGPTKKDPRPSRMGKGREGAVAATSSVNKKDRIFIALTAPKMGCASVNRI